MATTTVNDVLTRVSVVLQDSTNVHWQTNELLSWINESYQHILLARPEANAITANVNLALGTLQSIPSDGVAMVSIVRNVAGNAIRYIERAILDDQIPNWHVLSPTLLIKHYVYDRNNPRQFYVYPPADTGAKVEMIYSSVPTPHIDTTGTVKLDDRYVPAIVDYVLYRAYQKDADYAANDQRSASAYQTFLNSLGVGAAAAAAR